MKRTLTLLLKLYLYALAWKKLEAWWKDVNSERLKVSFLLLRILRLLIQPPLRPHRSLSYHGTKTPVATRPELHKSDFLLCSTPFNLHPLTALFDSLSLEGFQWSLRPGKNARVVCMHVSVCLYARAQAWEKAYRKTMMSVHPLHAFLSLGVPKCPPLCVVTLRLSLGENHHRFSWRVINPLPGTNHTSLSCPNEEDSPFSHLFLCFFF